MRIKTIIIDLIAGFLTLIGLVGTFYWIISETATFEFRGLIYLLIGIALALLNGENSEKI